MNKENISRVQRQLAHIMRSNGERCTRKRVRTVRRGAQRNGPVERPVPRSAPTLLVRPVKAGVSSGSQSRQGKNQEPCSSDGREEGNQISEAHRQRHESMTASHRAAAEANAEVAPKVSGPGGRARNRKGEGSKRQRTLAHTLCLSGGVGAAAR